MDAREICRSLSEMHSLLFSLRENRPREVRVAGATAFMRPGQDSEFPSSGANRLMVHDPVGHDVVETVRAGKAVMDEAGISHWFLELGAGITVEQVRALMKEFGARPRLQVRYPVLARVPGEMPAVATSLEIRRPSAAELLERAAEIDAIWGSPGSGRPTMNAAGRPDNFAPVFGLADGRAVAMGMLVIGDVPGGLAYLSAGGTHVDYRNRGGQSAIIAERVRIAKERGRGVCVSETVLTVETSTSNLLKAGFEIAFEWVVLEVGIFARS